MKHAEQLHDYGRDLAGLDKGAADIAEADDDAYASPAIDFLNASAGKPIAAEITRERGQDIQSYFSQWTDGYPKRLGGFVIPGVVGNAQLQISRRANSKTPIGN